VRHSYLYIKKAFFLDSTIFASVYSQSSSTLHTGSSNLFDTINLKKKHAPEVKSSILSQNTRIHERVAPSSPPRIKSPRIDHHHSSPHALMQHHSISQHSTPQKTSYVCERCYTNFFTEGELLLHERIHHGIMLTPVIKTNNHALDLNIIEPTETVSYLNLSKKYYCISECCWWLCGWFHDRFWRSFCWEQGCKFTLSTSPMGEVHP